MGRNMTAHASPLSSRGIASLLASLPSSSASASGVRTIPAPPPLVSPAALVLGSPTRKVRKMPRTMGTCRAVLTSYGTAYLSTWETLDTLLRGDLVAPSSDHDPLAFEGAT